MSDAEMLTAVLGPAKAILGPLLPVILVFVGVAKVLDALGGKSRKRRR